MTSSARASSVGGISIPSALAVLRLMSNSNVVGVCTGTRRVRSGVLLRARRQRPRHRAAEECDERAPFQLIELHPLPLAGVTE
jgi:hypothetical protein